MADRADHAGHALSTLLYTAACDKRQITWEHPKPIPLISFQFYTTGELTGVKEHLSAAAAEAAPAGIPPKQVWGRHFNNKSGWQDERQAGNNQEGKPVHKSTTQRWRRTDKRQHGRNTQGRRVVTRERWNQPWHMGTETLQNKTGNTEWWQSWLRRSEANL